MGASVFEVDFWRLLSMILFYHSDLNFDVKLGNYIVQLIIYKIIIPNIIEVDGLDSTFHGSGGFRSIGA